MPRGFILTLFAVACSFYNVSAASETDLQSRLKTLLSVGGEGEGNAAAKKAWSELAREAKPGDLPLLLAALDDADALSANWVRAAVDAVAERAVRDDVPLPKKALEKFVFNTEHAPRARRLAYEWLARVDETAEDRIIPKLLNDPSVEFRRDAVQRLLDEAKKIPKNNKQKLVPLYEKALSGARDQDQVEFLAKALGDLGRPVDLPRHFGFIQRWKLIGPFDNTGKKGFPVKYPPEATIDFSATYDGKTGMVKWRDHTTDDKYGMVDLNKAIAKHMGAAAYAAAQFESDKQRTVELRLSSICAVKMWLNGKPLLSREVYHAGTKIDQYPVAASLKKGTNVILIKCLQNEQTEDWAQDWSFQLRVCDPAGTAVLSEERGRQDRIGGKQ